ncbi:MAG: VIT1/CCC1 transporter family protein [Armatimonadota bacterium]
MEQTSPHEMHGARQERGLLKAIRELVFGAEDGLVSILGLVTGVAAGTTDTKTVLLAGVVGAVSGAISMAAGNYLGVKSHIEVLQRRMSEEAESIRHCPDHERAELVDYYRERGLTPSEVHMIVPAVMRNQAFLMEEMAAHELGISPGELEAPASKAFWIFIAYIVAAVFPVLPYALFSHYLAMRVSIASTMIALFGVGAAKTAYTRRSWLKSGIEMLAIAMAAGLLGYLAGRMVHL